MTQAAIVASRWHLDIVTVLAEPDPFLWAVRIAGHQAMNHAEEAARKRSKGS